MHWHKKCRKADISIIEVSPGQLIPCCMSCGESAAPESHTVARPPANGWNIPHEPHPRNRNLYWPDSVEYIDENPPDVGDAFIESPKPAPEQQVKELNSLDRAGENQKHFIFDKMAGRQIRLLELSKGGTGDLLHVQLTIQPFRIGLDYEALSYTWATDTGERDATHTVYHGDSWDILKVTENCANALRRLRYQDETRILWVDAICINQEDVAERSHQVNMMTEIYACARQVLVYLGDQEPTGDHYEQILTLCKRPYFSRIWVVQELAFAAAKRVICGSKSWSWDDFYSVAQGFSWLEHVNRRKFREASELFRLISGTRLCDSSDKRDRIFALLGLVTGSRGLGLIPDYTLCLSHVMIGTAACILTGHYDTEARALLMDAAHKNIEGGPSWVPDWISNELKRLTGHSVFSETHDTHCDKPILQNRISSGDPIRCGQLVFYKKTGILKTRGFCVAAGSSLDTMTASSESPFSFYGKLLLCAEIQGFDATHPSVGAKNLCRWSLEWTLYHP
ncbi:unnamed protein product [Clonostachys rosea]|uniref:Heterokaryon incompatibility domain-containing protein n=1 Tax=Bionectria ochroleuca TaxID=29856 RepID=A0ABY6UDI5_BIOOC|nr:unnamed protein product [Clonostachys rosea]